MSRDSLSPARTMLSMLQIDLKRLWERPLWRMTHQRAARQEPQYFPAPAHFPEAYLGLNLASNSSSEVWSTLFRIPPFVSDPLKICFEDQLKFIMPTALVHACVHSIGKFLGKTFCARYCASCWTFKEYTRPPFLGSEHKWGWPVSKIFTPG